MRATLVGLTLLLTATAIGGAPVPDPNRLPKQRLEALKKRLTVVVDDWLKESTKKRWLPERWTCRPELPVLRRVDPDRAKAVIRFAAFDNNGARERDWDTLLTVFLSYQDGCWTTEQFQANNRSIDTRAWREDFAFLMLAIDEAAEK